MCGSPLLLGGGTRNAYKDIVKRWARHRETGNPRPAHQRPQDLLRIASAPHPQLLHLAEIMYPLDAWQVANRRHAAFHGNADRVVAVLLLNLRQRPVQHLPAPEDHENLIAE